MEAKDLEPIVGTEENVSSVLSGQKELTLKSAQKLKSYFQLPADVFMPEV